MDYAGGPEGCGKTNFAQIVQVIEIVRKNLQAKRRNAKNERIPSTFGNRHFRQNSPSALRFAAIDAVEGSGVYSTTPHASLSPASPVGCVV
jgi:hypothetical protein